MSVEELKAQQISASENLNALRERVHQKRLPLQDTDVASYASSLGRTAVSFSSTDLVCCRILQGHAGKVYALDWSNESNRIVSASQDGRLIVWNALTSQKTHYIKLPCAWVMTCAFSPGGQSVACGGLDSVCSIFSLNSPSDQDGNLPVSRTLSGHRGYVSCCQYVPDGETHLITSSGDQTCILWDVTTGLKVSTFGGEFSSGHDRDVSRSQRDEGFDGGGGGRGGHWLRLRQCDVEEASEAVVEEASEVEAEAKEEWMVEAEMDTVVVLSISKSNPKLFISGSCDATARLWDTRTATRATHTFHGHEGDVSTVKFFPDGQQFGTGSDDGSCRLFDIRTGHQLQAYYQELSDADVPTVTSIAFSVSGRLLFVGYSNRNCYIWDTIMARVVLDLGSLQNSHDDRVSCLALSADGSALCTGSWDRNLKIWAFGGDRRVVV
ncbi:hypothetical protein Sjap_016899 [Stephania japonica]|uniref:Uncharacterized protein n=1 Tax=Stephania japonica TaxID=461633 RepID=A0AAP0I552_9MAGN